MVDTNDKQQDLASILAEKRELWRKIYRQIHNILPVKRGPVKGHKGEIIAKDEAFKE